MFRYVPAFLLLCAVFWVPGCESTPDFEPKTARYPWVHTAEFMWDQTKEALRAKWRIASEDRTTNEVLTEWDTQLSPMNTFGRRNRLRVKVVEDEGKGFDITATQESERNTNQTNPLSREEASWEETPNDGGYAVQFLVDLERRLRPARRWEENEAR